MSWTITGTEKVTTDPYRSQVSLLLHGDGANGSTTITDSSPTPKTVTAVGDAKISTAQSKFGGSSIAFDGSGDYLSIPSNIDFRLGAENFTIEFWIRYNTVSGVQILFDTRPTAGTGLYPVIYSNGATLSYFTNASDRITVLNAVAAGAWYYVALVKNSGLTKLYLNGLQVGSAYADSNDYLCGPLLFIGNDSYTPALYAFNGYIDDLRITKGVARYTANFTPPTAPFPDI